MSLSMEMMYCAGRLLGDAPAQGGGEERKPRGTCFVVTMPSTGRPNVRYGYLLTAHHVIAGQHNVEVQMPDPYAQGELCPPIRITDWRQPLEGVDLALAPFRLGVEYDGRVMASGPEHILPSNLSPHLGARIYYIGIAVAVLSLRRS